LSHVTGAQLQAFGLVDWNSQNVTMVKIRAWWWDSLTHGSFGLVP
jgi:hypothetical protein